MRSQIFMYGQTCYNRQSTTFKYLIHDIVCRNITSIYKTVQNWLYMVAHIHDNCDQCGIKPSYNGTNVLLKANFIRLVGPIHKMSQTLYKTTCKLQPKILPTITKLLSLSLDSINMLVLGGVMMSHMLYSCNSL